MSLLDYIFHEQCSNNRFGPIAYPTVKRRVFNKSHVKDTASPMGCSLSKRNSYIREEKEKDGHMLVSRDPNPLYDPWGPNIVTVDVETSLSQEKDPGNVYIVDLRTDHTPLISSKGSNARKSSESQTEPVEGVDFDWDLTDKTDTETQTRPPSRVKSSKPEPSDAIVQTDQRIVFPGSARQSAASGRKVTFADEEDVSIRDAWSQTRWNTHDIAVQVLPRDLDSGEGAEWSDWRRNDHESVNTATQVIDFDSSFPNPSLLDGVENDVPDDDDHTVLDGGDHHDVFGGVDNASMQVDLSMRAIAAGTDSVQHSTPVGVALHKSLHFDDDLDEPLYNIIKKSSIATSKTRKQQQDGPGDGQQTGESRIDAGVENRVDVGVQTDQQIKVAEMNGYAVLPPLESKQSFLGAPSAFLFQTVDDHVKEVSRKWYKSIKKLVRHLLQVVDQVEEYVEKRELITVRAIYSWVVQNIRYDPSFLDHQMTTIDILRYRAGVCRDYVKIFQEMCGLANIKVQTIFGFARKHDFKPGDLYTVDSEVHAWCAVHIHGSWRLIDPTFGAGYYSRASNEYIHQPQEFYFLPNPFELIYTHLPYSPPDTDYMAWQLLPHPLTLEQFNSLSYLSPEFFENDLEMVSEIPCPWNIQDTATIKFNSKHVTRYRFKLYIWGERESDKMNNFVLHELEGEERKTARFFIKPPFISTLIFKIYAKKESDIIDQSTRLEHIASFSIKAKRVFPKIQPWPKSDVGWGLQTEYHKLGCVLVIDDPHKWEGVKIVMVVGTKAMFKFLHKEGPLVASSHLYDYKGSELIEEMDNHGQGTLFLISRTNPLPGQELKQRQETGELRTYVSTKVTKRESLFTVVCPPHTGYYKLDIFAAKCPDKKGKLEMPLVATFIVEVRLKTLFAEVAVKVSGTDVLIPPSSFKLPPIGELSRPSLSQSSSRDSDLYRQSTETERRNSRAKLFQKTDHDRTLSATQRTSIFSLSRNFSIVPESVISSDEGRY